MSALLERGSRLRALSRTLLGRSWLSALMLLLWEAVTRLAASPYFPPPTRILSAMRERWFPGALSPEALAHFPPSLGRLLSAWLIACVLGVVLGVGMGRLPWLADLLGPLVHFGRAMPSVALLPLFLVLFSIGPRLQIATIVFGVTWPVLINSLDGARTIEPLHLDLSRVFRISRTQRFFRIILPSAAPKICAGLRLAISLALILMVISELVGSTEGFGYLLNSSSSDLPLVWGLIVLLGLLGVLFNAAFLALERRLLHWREPT